MVTKATNSVLNLVSPPIDNMVLSRGTLDNSTIGATVPAPGHFSQIYDTELAAVLIGAPAGHLTPVTIGTGLTMSVGGVLSVTSTPDSVFPFEIAHGGTNNIGPFTAGSVIYSDGTRLTQNNAGLFFNGTLGVGTNAPAATLDVNGSANIRSGIAVTGNANVSGGITVGPGGIMSGGSMDIVTNANASGIGIVCPNPVVEFQHPGGGGNTWVLSHTDPALFTWAFNASGRASIDQFGNMSIAGILSSASDVELKKNVINMEPVLDRVLKLRPVRFNFNETPEVDSIGLIAQEFNEHFPELVQPTMNGTLGIAYGHLTTVLVGAIQEIYGELTALKMRIDKLSKPIKPAAAT